LHENANAIEAWRENLPDQQRRRLIGAQANVKRWRKSHGDQSPPVHHWTRDALMHWRRFRACLEAMSPDQATMIWQAAAAEIATHHTAPARTRVCVGSDVGIAVSPE
jgi:hypothetical protein